MFSIVWLILIVQVLVILRIYVCGHVSDTNFCIDVSCENGGTCIPLPRDFRCECPEQITGRYCERSKYRTLRILTILTEILYIQK